MGRSLIKKNIDIIRFISLIDNCKISKGDVIVVLCGDGYNRINEAIKLYKRKYAQMIVLSGGKEDISYGSIPADKLVLKLYKHRIPKKYIYLEKISQNTKEQAQNVLALCKERHWKKVLLVASHYHQYRAFLTFLSQLIKLKMTDIQLINCPVRDLDWFEINKWGKRINLLEKEFEKIFYYQSSKQLPSFKTAINYFHTRN